MPRSEPADPRDESTPLVVVSPITPVASATSLEDSDAVNSGVESVRSHRRLLWWLGPSSIGLFAMYGAVPQLLLPLQLSEIDAVNKVANFAVVSTVAALLAMVAQPIAGIISDRTRSRFGKRAPLLVGGALVGGLSLVALALADSVLVLGIAYAAALTAYSFAQAPQSAILPDRVPRSLRGTFAAVIGASAMVGNLGGTILASQLAGDIPTVYFLLAGVTVILFVLFVAFNPDVSSKDEPKARLDLASFFGAFWVDPRKHPDFAWAFVGRFALYLAYYATAGFQLYVLQDYIGLGDDAVALVPLLGLASLPAILLAIFISGRLSDRLGRRKPFVFASSVIVALGLLVPLLSPTVPGMFVSAVLIAFGFGAFQAVDTALMSEVLPGASSYAKDMGVINLAIALPTTFAPAVAGAIVLMFGYAGLFPIAAGIGLLGAFAVFAIKSVR